MRILGVALCVALLAACGSNATFSGSKVDDRQVPDQQQANAIVNDGTDGSSSTDRHHTNGSAESQTVEAKFDAIEVKTAAAQFEVDANGVSFELTQTNEYEAKETTKKQEARRSFTDSETQGTAETTGKNRFAGDEYGILDILIVIDSSLSMKAEQSKVLANMPALISRVQDSDWRIGIVTTDPNSGNDLGVRSIVPPDTTQSYVPGCLRKVIHKNEHVANPSGEPTLAETKFAEGIDAGLSGTGNEQGIRMALEGLNCEYETGETFLRPNSTVAVLIISDEDNCSGGSCNGSDWKNATEADWPGSTAGDGSSLIQHLHQIRSDVNQTAVFGLIALENNECPSDSYDEYKGITYMNVINNTGGFYASACGTADDYANTLTSISQSVQNVLQKTFSLTKPAYQDKALVYKGPKTEGDDSALTQVDAAHYTVSGNQLTFVEAEAPTEDERIVVTYTVAPSTLIKDVELSAKPDPATLKLTVNGAVAAKNLYEIVEENGKSIIRFANYPAENAMIRADYRMAGTLPTAFDIGDNVRKSSVKAFINDVQVNNFTVKPDGTVTFATAPGDDANLRFTFDEDLGPVLDYDLPFVPDGTHNFIASTDDGEEVEFDISGAKATFKPAQHVTNRKLTVTLFTEEGSRHLWKLGHTPLDGSLAIEGTKCKLGKEIILDGKELSAECDFATASKVTIAYKYNTVRTEYRLDEVSKDSIGKWTVWIDDEETSDFVVNGNVIILNSTPDADAKVRILFSPPMT